DAIAESQTEPTIVGYNREVNELAVDGERFYAGRPPIEGGTTKPALYIKKISELASQSDPSVDPWPTDYWHEAGYYMPRFPSEFGSGQSAQSELVRFASQSGARCNTSEETLDGDSCLRIEITHADQRRTFFLDKAMGYAVRRRMDETI